MPQRTWRRGIAGSEPEVDLIVQVGPEVGADEVAQAKGNVVELADANDLVVGGVPDLVVAGVPESWVGGDDEIHHSGEVSVQHGKKSDDRFCCEKIDGLPESCTQVCHLCFSIKS